MHTSGPKREQPSTRRGPVPPEKAGHGSVWSRGTELASKRPWTRLRSGLRSPGYPPRKPPDKLLMLRGYLGVRGGFHAGWLPKISALTLAIFRAAPASIRISPGRNRKLPWAGPRPDPRWTPGSRGPGFNAKGRASPSAHSPPSCPLDSTIMLQMSKEKVLQHIGVTAHSGAQRSWSVPAASAARRSCGRSRARR